MGDHKRRVEQDLNLSHMIKQTLPVSFNEDENMILVPEGTYELGVTDEIAGMHYSLGNTRRSVTLTAPFQLSKIPVTWETWLEVTKNVGVFNIAQIHDNPLLPVMGVTWTQAILFCNAFSEAMGYKPAYNMKNLSSPRWRRKTGKGFRLPSAAEWEVAARSCSPEPYPPEWAAKEEMTTLAAHLENQGWTNRTSTQVRTVDDPHHNNPMGFRDMIGNVAEWVWDKTYGTEILQKLTDPVSGTLGYRGRVTMGGGISPARAHYLYPGVHYPQNQSITRPNLGFRLARNG